MAIPDRFRLLSRHSVTRSIEGQDFVFYPVSLRVAARMAPLLAQLARHFSTLLSGDRKVDQGRTEEDFTNQDGDVVQKTRLDPINPELARIRADQREAAVAGAVEALLADKHRLALGELLMDSLRDDFPRGAKARSASDIQEFVDEMEIPVFVEFLLGLAQANAKVFGDLGKEIGRAVQERAGSLLGKASLAASGTDGSTSKPDSSG